jgi:hypothetical protein
MSYIGSAPQSTAATFAGVYSQSFNGNGSTTTFTLGRYVAQAANIEVIVNNVQQSPFDGSYSLTGGTSLVFSEAPSSGTNNIYVVYRDYPVQTLTDTGAVRKSGDTMTGALTLTNNNLISGVARVGNVTSSGLFVDNTATGDKTPIAIRTGNNDTVPFSIIEAGKLYNEATAYSVLNLTRTNHDNASGVHSGMFFESKDTSGTIREWAGITGQRYSADANNNRGRLNLYVSTDNSTARQLAASYDYIGRYTNTNQPAFHALRTSGEVAANTVVLWNNVLLNTGSSYNSSNGRFTAPIAGRYFLHTRMNNSGGAGIHPEIRINGANSDNYRGFSQGGTSGAYHASVTAIVQMNAGDYADVVTGNYNPMQGTPGHNNGFCGYLIG